jgi:hypothetical protein
MLHLSSESDNSQFLAAAGAAPAAPVPILKTHHDKHDWSTAVTCWKISMPRRLMVSLLLGYIIVMTPLGDSCSSWIVVRSLLTCT